MSQVPSERYHDFFDPGGGGGDIPPSEFQALKARVSQLESTILVLHTSIGQLKASIASMEKAVRRLEFTFMAPDTITAIGGGQWRLCGAYRCFDTLTLETVRGYSLDWPTGSIWQIVAIRASGAQEVQNISSFQFETSPTMNPVFEVGDILAVLVRNFTADPGETPGLDENPAMCSMIFMRGNV